MMNGGIWKVLSSGFGGFTRAACWINVASNLMTATAACNGWRDGGWTG